MIFFGLQEITFVFWVTTVSPQGAFNCDTLKPGFGQKRFVRKWQESPLMRADMFAGVWLNLFPRTLRSVGRDDDGSRQPFNWTGDSQGPG